MRINLLFIEVRLTILTILKVIQYDRWLGYLPYIDTALNPIINQLFSMFLLCLPHCLYYAYYHRIVIAFNISIC